MNAPNLDAARQRITEVAKLAGIRGNLDDKGRFVAGFTLANKRSQLVYVRPTMQMPAGTVVTIYSPCRHVKGGFLSRMSREDAIELLKTNENIPFARYSIMADDSGEMMVMAGLDALLETLDPTELNTYMWSVATFADAYEAKHEDKDRKDAY